MFLLLPDAVRLQSWRRQVILTKTGLRFSGKNSGKFTSLESGKTSAKTSIPQALYPSLNRVLCILLPPILREGFVCFLQVCRFYLSRRRYIRLEWAFHAIILLKKNLTTTLQGSYRANQGSISFFRFLITFYYHNFDTFGEHWGQCSV